MAKWRKRPTVLDARMGPDPVSTVLSAEQEAIAVAFIAIGLLLGLAASFLTLPHPATPAGVQLPEPFTQHVS